MAGSFAELMALSQSQTRQSDAATQALLAERRRKEETARKEQEERERKERDLQARVLKKQLEDERRERERQEKAEEEERRRERIIQKREEEQRNVLLYGPKKAKAEKHGHGREERNSSSSRKQRESSPGSASGAAVLTREEKRQRRMQTELNRSFPSKKSSHTSGYTRVPKVLRGGAIDVTNDGAAAHIGSSATAQSVKQRIAAQGNTLTRLNVVKRDTRTIDEILQDRARARETKVLDGDEAREFHDWFSKPKKKDNLTPATKGSSSLQPSRSISPSSSGAITPNPQTKPSEPVPRHSSSSTAKPNGSKASGPHPSSKRSATPTAVLKQPKTVIRVINVDTTKPAMIFKGNVKPQASSSTSKPLPSRAASSSRETARSVTPPRKRRRSLSDSPPPAKKRSAHNSISSEIWKLFGKDRDRYVNDDVFSDDEDMEADAEALRREELRSARLAKKEDEAALDEERRHEELKRQRKKEKEMRERKGLR